LLALASSAAVEAHTIFTTLYVNGVSQGDGVGIRMRKDPKTADYPISLNDSAMACGYDGEQGNPRVISVNDGDTLSFEWRAIGDDPSKGAIDPGHYGPCGIYLKKVDSATNDQGVGDGWFKLWDEGYDESTSQWCNQKLGGADDYGVYQHRLSIDLPSGLQGGYYLARPEILALHKAVDNPPDPQFYTGCAQIYLKSDGTKLPQSTVSIPGYVQADDSSVTFNVYDKPLHLPYDTPGPAVANLIESGQTGATIGQGSQSEGTLPAKCVMENGGWCGYEVAAYDNMTGCYAAAQDCWNQNTDCWNYASKLPTGGVPWCNDWADKCQNIDDQCDAKNYDGPPDDGKDLTPSPTSISVVMAAATSNLQAAVEKVAGSTAAASSEYAA
ncbi:lytic polysaccharide monooxygenase, partial [Saccharata proteae CBS 121410]